jgi:hypothetical protein
MFLRQVQNWLLATTRLYPLVKNAYRASVRTVNFHSCMEVCILTSTRSEFLIHGLVHLRNSLQKAEIDVGVIVVPDDRMQKFLPDRTPAFSDAVRYIEVEFKEATTFPIVVLGIEHDSPARAMPKKTTNLGTGKA